MCCWVSMIFVSLMHFAILVWELWFYRSLSPLMIQWLVKKKKLRMELPLTEPIHLQCEFARSSSRAQRPEMIVNMRTINSILKKKFDGLWPWPWSLPYCWRVQRNLGGALGILAKYQNFCHSSKCDRLGYVSVASVFAEKLEASDLDSLPVRYAVFTSKQMQHQT